MCVTLFLICVCDSVPGLCVCDSDLCVCVTLICTDMALAYCQDVPYSSIMFPNIIGHRNRVEAELGAEYLLMSVMHGLLNGECSEELRLLGCSVLAPRCQAGRMLKPCRSSCEAVRKGCSHAFEGIEMAWPYFLDCDRFFVSDQEGCYDPLSQFKGRGLEEIDASLWERNRDVKIYFFLLDLITTAHYIQPFSSVSA